MGCASECLIVWWVVVMVVVGTVEWQQLCMGYVRRWRQSVSEDRNELHTYCVLSVELQAAISGDL